MFNVVTGPFYPTLESHLIQEIRQLKSSDPFVPLAIVVPSELLRRHLQRLLCVEHQCALFDVHFLTFHQLALRLQQERVLLNPDEGVVHFELVHDVFFEHLVNALINESLPTLGLENASGLSPGTCQALWRTIRDLKEAMIDPKLVLQGIHEGLFGEETCQALQDLLALYEKVEANTRSQGLGSADDLASLVIGWVAQSRFLSKVKRGIYYGFYDLTQVQLSLFEAIAERIEVTVCFPLSHDPAFTFARRFFERHLMAGAQIDRGSSDPRHDSHPPVKQAEGVQIQVLNAVGPDDELTTACKEILRLVEIDHYRYEDIGIVARTLEPYQSSLGRTFDQHRIPFTSSALVSVMQEPLIKHLVQLSSLFSTNFFWRDVLDVLASPYYRLDRLGITREEIRPELWHMAIRTLGIHRGQEQWQRLAGLSWVGLTQESRSEPREGRTATVGLEARELRLLNRIVSELIGDYQALPTRGSVGELTRAFFTLAQKHLALPGSTETPAGALYDIPDKEGLAETIQQVLSILHEIHRLNETVTWEKWAHLFQGTLKVCTVPIVPSHGPGVKVLDAMSARGLPFRALFVLGLNEKVFPRFVREDAFLRDRDRRVLAATLGYKIDEKLAGYDEERLLFALLEQAARERLYLVYQRADKEGRPVAPSSYLTGYLSPDGALNSNRVITIPRRLSDQFTHPLFDSRFLTREEFGIKLISQGYDPSSLLQHAKREPILFRNGWNALQEIQRHSRRLGPYDGYIGSVDAYWREVAEKGVTPTSLEDYARCPFQYFSRHVLQFKSIRLPMIQELAPSALGELCHAVLQQCYRQLISGGWPERELSPVSIREEVSSSGAEVFDRYSEDHATGYYLTWQLAKEKVIRLINLVVESDQQDYWKHGFRPIAFEVDSEGKLTGLGSPVDPLKIRGIPDRVDERSHPSAMRIVDYKYKAGSRMSSHQRDLLLSGIRGLALQPPLYVMLTDFHDPRLQTGREHAAVSPDRVEFVFLAPAWENQVVRSGFDSASWKGPSGLYLRKTVGTIVNGIRSGEYFIVPGDYCRHCEVSTACRREHGPTWWRSRRASQARQLRQLRTQDKQSD